ncbi:MAG: hypothetical protein HC905_08085 [Bacteroidales bacterium]|nr:hypothetical protein [Bacteroidales bacterium]
MNITYFIFSFLYLLFHWQQFQLQNYWWITWIIARIINVIWVYLSYFVLKGIAESKKLDITITEAEGRIIPIADNASGWQRLFHLITDLYLCIFIFSAIIPQLFPKITEAMGEMLGERGTIYAFVFVFRLIYYPFFEIILGATPAKFLTETRVTDEIGNKATPGKIMLRTFARFIPFESFSFSWRIGLARFTYRYAGSS